LEVSEELFAPDLAALLAQELKTAATAKKTKCDLNMEIILSNRMRVSLVKLYQAVEAQPVQATLN
jgi:hypothetical protein